MASESVAQSIVARIVDRLRGSGYLVLEDVACDVRGNSVVLTGRLPSHYLKQVAQTIVAGVEGVRRVVNRIAVEPPRSGR
jgi:osmotically-inducible protein OsmY